MNIHIIDRSNLDDIVCVIPKENYRQVNHRDYLTEHQGRFHRADIVLVNATNSGKEYCLYVTETGFTGDVIIMDFLTEKQIKEVHEIAERMRQNAIDFPPSAAYIR